MDCLDERECRISCQVRYKPMQHRQRNDREQRELDSAKMTSASERCDVGVS